MSQYSENKGGCFCGGGGKGLGPCQDRRIPQLSYRQYSEGTESEQMRFIEDFFLGLRDSGGVILSEPDVEQNILNESEESSRTFLSLPQSVKKKYLFYSSEHSEYWQMGREVPKGHRFHPYYAFNKWPVEVPDFKASFSKLYRDLEAFSRSLLRALTFPLEIDYEYFDRATEDGSSILRLSQNPRGRLSDNNLFSMILVTPAVARESGIKIQDLRTEGPQNKTSWLSPDLQPGDILVLAGRMLSRITNEVIPAAVTELSLGSNCLIQYYSLPNPEAILSCIPSCKSSGAKFPDITAYDFLAAKNENLGMVDQEK